MPLWICMPLGAGVAKAVPGAVLVADAGSSPDGVVARWQLSQTVDDGMCALGPAGLVAGMPTRLAMPANAAAVPFGRWQLAQLLLMPAWFISEPLNFAPLPTGRLLIDEPTATWQTSQEAEVGMWLDGRPTMLKLAAGMAKEAADAPWHWTQLFVVLGAKAWILASVGITA
jgi:hypothetical protein